MASMQDETAPNVNNVSGVLKGFVILGGVLIVVGMIVLVIMIIIRGATTTGDAPKPGVTPAGPVDLALPSGVRISQVLADGRRLVLVGEGDDGQQYIAVVDADSGERKTLIRVTSEE